VCLKFPVPSSLMPCYHVVIAPSVVQENKLLPFLTVRDHVEVAASLLAQPGFRDNVDDLIADVGLEDVQHKRVLNLGVGQKRLLSVLLAFVGDPGVVYLDEVRGHAWACPCGVVRFGPRYSGLAFAARLWRWLCVLPLRSPPAAWIR
jgi:hypothetical protein